MFIIYPIKFYNLLNKTNYLLSEHKNYYYLSFSFNKQFIIAKAHKSLRISHNTTKNAIQSQHPQQLQQLRTTKHCHPYRWSVNRKPWTIAHQLHLTGYGEQGRVIFGWCRMYTKVIVVTKASNQVDPDMHDWTKYLFAYNKVSYSSLNNIIANHKILPIHDTL